MRFARASPSRLAILAARDGPLRGSTAQPAPPRAGARLKKKFRALDHLDYLSIDIESPLADEKMDLTRLDLEDQSFDCSYCSHVLEHIQDDRAVMSELYRVLWPGGWA